MNANNKNEENCAKTHMKEIIKKIQEQTESVSCDTIVKFFQVLLNNFNLLEQLDFITSITSCKEINKLLTDLCNSGLDNYLLEDCSKFDDTNIDFLCNVYLKFVKLTNLNNIPGRPLLNTLNNIIEKSIRVFTPDHDSLETCLIEWLKLLKSLEQIESHNKAVTKIPLLVYAKYYDESNKQRDISYSSPANFMKIAEQVHHDCQIINDDLFYKFIARQVMLIYQTILSENNETLKLYPGLSTYLNTSLTRLAICHRIDKFWNNILLSYIVDEDATLNKINLLASECYRHCPPVKISKLINDNEDGTPLQYIYDMALEKYLIDHHKH